MGWAVQVEETRLNATRAGAEWWALFQQRHRDTDRIQLTTVSPGGARAFVACDSKEDAEQLRAFMIDHGFPVSSVKVTKRP
jgi:hypothetical protein